MLEYIIFLFLVIAFLQFLFNLILKKFLPKKFQPFIGIINSFFPGLIGISLWIYNLNFVVQNETVLTIASFIFGVVSGVCILFTVIAAPIEVIDTLFKIKKDKVKHAS